MHLFSCTFYNIFDNQKIINYVSTSFVRQSKQMNPEVREKEAIYGLLIKTTSKTTTDLEGKLQLWERTILTICAQPVGSDAVNFKVDRVRPTKAMFTSLELLTCWWKNLHTFSRDRSLVYDHYGVTTVSILLPF